MKRTIAVKCSKRGNDVYRYRVNNRLKLLSEALDQAGIRISLYRTKDGRIDPSRSRSNTVFATFTTWTVLQSREDAWANPERMDCPYELHKKCLCWTKLKCIPSHRRFAIKRSISLRWNKYMARLRKRFGRVEVVRSFESTEQGYPHIHAELIFKDLTEDELFHVFEHVDKDGKISLRIEEQDSIKKLWDDRVVDIRVPWNIDQAKDYIMKEIFKNGFSAKLGTKTLSMLWVFRKRAFAISRSIQEIMDRLDNGMHNSNQKSKALDLFGLPINDLDHAKWVFVAVFSWNKILDLVKPGQKSGLWAYELTGVPK
jgi:hypothetical protein